LRIDRLSPRRARAIIANVEHILRNSFAPAAERLWARQLLPRSDWSPAEGPLLVIAPHPEDEIMGAGGLIHTWAGMGRPVTVVSVTDGEAALPLRAKLDLIRREELKEALRKLSATHVSVVRLGLPDGRVVDFQRRLRSAILSLIEPEMTLIAPYERDGHPDHDAVGRVCCEIARSRGIPLARYPIWTWQRANPSEFRDVRWGKFPLDPEARRAKTYALQCFMSRLQPGSQDSARPKKILNYFQRPYEAFIL
jgi:LmbE family N-acetylglucosaminyl deacetylase